MPSNDDSRAALEARIGHTFKDPKLLDRALTHSSSPHAAKGSYERLEFLGDRVLGLIIADMLMQHYPKEPEGHLSRRFNALVRKETLADIATEIGVGPEIRFGPSEVEDGAENQSILSDVCEALIAALFRDGGLDTARTFVEAHWTGRLDAAVKPPRDAKTTLQEWTMARGLGLPVYAEVGRSGPDHAPVFRIRVSVAGHGEAEAEGRAKRQAEQTAAKTLLESLPK